MGFDKYKKVGVKIGGEVWSTPFKDGESGIKYDEIKLARWLKRTCPKCGAKPDKPCTSLDGMSWDRSVHSARAST